MPTYEYKCRACGHAFERFQRISDSPVRTCPECRKRKVERLISVGGGIVFKGPGFYATDYRKEPPKTPRAPEETSSTGGSDSASEKGQKSKPKDGSDG
jgi:putative FmdB family regulatory protein